MGTLAVFLAAVGVACYELPKMIRSGKRREMTVFLILLCLSVGLYGANDLGIKIPNPIYLIEVIYKPVQEVVSHFLQ